MHHLCIMYLYCTHSIISNIYRNQASQQARHICTHHRPYTRIHTYDPHTFESDARTSSTVVGLSTMHTHVHAYIHMISIPLKAMHAHHLQQQCILMYMHTYIWSPYLWKRCMHIIYSSGPLNNAYSCTCIHTCDLHTFKSAARTSSTVVGLSTLNKPTIHIHTWILMYMHVNTHVH
jgi:hypothetical protein